ncbi:hypothetical protein DMUE_3214 [Dictyocoela muelleri]|nr:hypothetical protein DMUE_3214 [Dictyocoela muelleri]
MALVKRIFKRKILNTSKNKGQKNTNENKNYLKHINSAEITIKKRKVLGDKNVYNNNIKIDNDNKIINDKSLKDEINNNHKLVEKKNSFENYFLENNFERNSDLSIESPVKKIMVHDFIEEVIESPKRYRCSKRIDFNFK